MLAGRADVCVGKLVTLVYIQETSVIADTTMRVLRTGLYLTAGVSETQVHAAHIRVEMASLFTGAASEEQVHAAMIERLAEARRCVERAIHTHTDGTTGSGMVLVPGLLDDIKRCSCSHALWTWNSHAGDVMDRRLIPAGMNMCVSVAKEDLLE